MSVKKVNFKEGYLLSDSEEMDKFIEDYCASGTIWEEISRIISLYVKGENQEILSLLRSLNNKVNSLEVRKEVSLPKVTEKEKPVAVSIKRKAPTKSKGGLGSIVGAFNKMKD